MNPITAASCLIALVLICSQADFENQTPPKEHPVMNLPRHMRQMNWVQGADPNNGSCVIASMIDLLNWQGKHEMARRLKRKYGGAQDYASMKNILNNENIKYASTKGKFDVKFLKECVASRRGCMVGVMPYKKCKEPMHMVCLVDMTSTHAILLNNNNPSSYTVVDRNIFLAEWERSGSWALTPVYSPTSPRVK